MTLKVSELFCSIQGESTHSGRPFSFVRLSGCNLRCDWCDTEYARKKGTPYSISTMMARLNEFKIPRVTVTGGEPLIQEDAPGLIRRLLEEGFQVVVETNGSVDISIADSRSCRIMDIKCPSSGEHHQTDWRNLERLTALDEIKFVIADSDDYAYAKNCLTTIGKLPFPRDHILFSTVSDRLSPKRLAEWILDDQLDVRLQLQLHKYIWGPRERGV